MNPNNGIPFEYIYTPESLTAAVREIGGNSVIAIDTEANSRFYYPEQLCLLQIGTAQRIYLIDSLRLKDLRPLESILANPEIVKVIHEASYDLSLLARNHRIQARNIFDTALAARFADISKVGLSGSLQEVLGLAFDKNERLQKSNWGRRPLSSEALEYAADDVRYLLPLRAALVQRLTDLGRLLWVSEECRRLEGLEYSNRASEDAYFSVKGTGRLQGRSLAVLRSLYWFREREALSLHQPPWYIISDQALVWLARHPKARPEQVPGLNPRWVERFGENLQQALKEGLHAALPVAAPPAEKLNGDADGRVGTRDDQERRLERLKAWRVLMAQSVKVTDASIIWPTSSLVRLSRDPFSLETEYASSEARTWQKEAFGESLAEELKRLSPRQL